jgi:hypothetical protein
MKRTTYRLLVRAEPGVVDEIRALRAWLKQGLRLFGLRCVEVSPKKERESAMDARKFASKYVKPDHVRDAPIQTRIVSVLEDERYDRLLLELETGSQFALNDGNTTTLIKAWGHDTDTWVGREIQLELGTYKDWRADPPEEKETVRVRAIPPAEAQNGSAPAAKPLPPSMVTPKSLKDDLSDEIPF